MSHFLLAHRRAGTGDRAVVDVRFPATRDVDLPLWVRPSTLLFLGLGFTLIVSGAIVTTSGTHPGADDVPRLYALLNVAYWHVRIAVTYVAVLAIFLFGLSRLETTSRRVPRLAWAVVALTGIQVVIGEVQWRSELPWNPVWAHAMTATLLWGTLVALGRTLLPAEAVNPSRAPSPSPVQA